MVKVTPLHPLLTEDTHLANATTNPASGRPNGSTKAAMKARLELINKAKTVASERYFEAQKSYAKRGSKLREELLKLQLKLNMVLHWELSDLRPLQVDSLKEI
jgi:hypothetical protein